MKTYTNKSNARRAARTQFATDADYTIVAVEGGFVIEAVANVVTVEEPVVGTFVNCPHCNVHLSNGVSSYENQAEVARTTGEKHCRITHEFVCLGCGEEFGEIVPEAVSKTASLATGTGIKIQKDRHEKNGVKRPSEGGICATLWALFEEMYAEKGMVPTPKPARERSAALNLDPTTTTVQLYRWREYMGFKGK